MKQIFNIPENCNATVEQVGNQIVLTFEPKVKEFKKGDFLFVKGFEHDWICIFKCKNMYGISYYAAYGVHNKFIIESEFNCIKKITFATTEQRQLLLSKLEENGYRFNEETCELERIKWEPKVKESFDYIAPNGTIDNILKLGFTVDKSLIKLGNCFKPGTLDQEKVSRLFAEFIQKVKDEHGIDY